MSFPALVLTPNVLAGPGADMIYSAEATGIPAAGPNVIPLPFVAAGVPPSQIDPTRLKVYYDPDPNRPAGGSLAPGVTDVRYVSLAVDKSTITLDFAQSAPGFGECRVSIEVDHSILGVSSASTPLIYGSGSGAGTTPPPTGFAVDLTGVGPAFFTPIEIGADLTSPTFNATQSGGVAVTATLQDTDGNGPTSVMPLPNLGLVWPFVFNEAANGATVTFTLIGDDGGGPVNDTVVATWLARVFFGASVLAVLTEAQIEALSGSALASTFPRSFTLSPVGQYIYYCWPASFGNAAPLSFQTPPPFPGGWVQLADVSITANTAVPPPAQLYHVWRTVNPLTGAGILTVVS